MHSPFDSQAIMATIDTALPQLSLGGIRVGTKGQQTAVLQTPLKFRLASANQGSSLRMPFGKPTSYGDSSRTADRENVNFSADTQELQAWADKLDKKIQAAALLSSLVTERHEYKPILKPSKREGYNPTISVKCQMTGPRKVRCWSPEMTRIEDDFDWNQVTVVPIVELRGIWRQNHQYGPTIDVTDMLVFSNDDGMCPFTLE